jgi:hypothetical protein
MTSPEFNQDGTHIASTPAAPVTHPAPVVDWVPGETEEDRTARLAAAGAEPESAEQQRDLQAEWVANNGQDGTDPTAEGETEPRQRKSQH